MKNLRSFKNFSVNENEEEPKFSFSELSKEAQENAIEELRDINVNYDYWHDDVIDQFKEDMEMLGLSDVEVSYSGFFSQGDGASFTADVSNNEVFMKEALGLESDEWLDMGDGIKPKDELDALRSDLLDIGFDTREKLTPENFIISIVRTSSRYSHENTIEGDVDIEDIPESIEDEFPFYKYQDMIQNKVTNWAREKSKNLYRGLEKEYDYLTSDEAVKEAIENNDYMFTEDGELA
jgi:hypothetical protein